MQGFIEVTDFDGEKKVLQAVSTITAVVQYKDGSVFVETGVDDEGVSLGVFVTESYEEIKRRLTQKDV